MTTNLSAKCDVMRIVLEFSTNRYADGTLWLLFSLTSSLFSGFAVRNLIFVSHPGMNTVYKDLLSVLFITDLLQASFMFPIFAWSSIAGYPTFCIDQPGINVFYPILVSLKFASISAIFLLTLNLHLQVVRPLRHWITRARQLWIGCIALTASCGVGIGVMVVLLELPRIGGVYLITIVSTVVILHIRTIVHVQSKGQIVHDQGPIDGSHVYAIRNIANAPMWVKKTVVTLSWFIGSLLLLTIVPAIILTVINGLGKHSTASRFIQRTVVKIIVCNHYANFGLYFWRNRTIKRIRQNAGGSRGNSVPNIDS